METGQPNPNSPPVERTDPPRQGPGLLDAGPILTAEFEYIAQTAFQANEDRARVTNLYLVMIASIIAALLGIESTSLPLPAGYWGLAVLFLVLALTSFLTLLQLMRLREAWCQSAEAMNQIKQYYAQHSVQADLKIAFKWSCDSMPAKCKPWSVSFLVAIQVCLLGGAATGVAAFFVGLAMDSSWWIPAVGAALIMAAAQMLTYWWMLRPTRAHSHTPAAQTR